MSDKELKQILENVYGQPSESFHQRFEKNVYELMEKRRSRRKKKLRFAFAFSLSLLLFTTALAVIHRSAIFTFYGETGSEYEYILPQAEEMVQRNLCSQRTGNILWQVKEAVYDGRILRILFSATDLNRKEPWTEKEKEEKEAFEQLEKENIALELFGNGSIYINGHEMSIRVMDSRYGENPGEVEFFIDSGMVYAGEKQERIYKPEGIMRIELPFSERNRNEMPPPLTFFMDASNHASYYQLSVPEKTVLPDGAVLEITDLHLSPATYVAEYMVTVKRELLPLDFPYTKEEIFRQNDEKELCFGDRWLALGLYNARGEMLGFNRETHHGIKEILENGDIVYQYHVEYSPDSRLTSVIYLVIPTDRGPFSLPISTEGQLSP